jgi:hypothetical protein
MTLPSGAPGRGIALYWLHYRHPDGCFAAFGTSDAGCRSLAHALSATRKRYLHMIALANVSGTAVQNEARNSIQNEGGDGDVAIA